MLNSLSGIAVNALNSLLTSTTASSRPPLHDVLKDYQVDDDNVVDYQPRAFGAIDIPFTPSRQITQTEGELLDNLTFKKGLMGLSEFKGLAENSFAESTARYPTPSNFPPQAGTSARSQNQWAQNDGHRDAFRHAYWNAQMTAKYGESFTKQFATAHETLPGNRADREAMDLYNNEVGREIALANPDASPQELADLVQQAVTDGKMIVIDSAGNLQWSDQVLYGQHGVADDPAVNGNIAVPNGEAYPGTS